jgi:hypothetical protein
MTFVCLSIITTIEGESVGGREIKRTHGPLLPQEHNISLVLSIVQDWDIFVFLPPSKVVDLLGVGCGKCHFYLPPILLLQLQNYLAIVSMRHILFNCSFHYVGLIHNVVVLNNFTSPIAWFSFST